MAIPPIKVTDVGLGRRFVKSFATRSIIPILLTEACVEAGRTYNAYDRGGFTEARERLTEEFTSAVVWIGGVPFFDGIIDKLIGKKILNLPEDSFSVGKDTARNPVANYIYDKFKGKNPEEVELMLGKYRTAKMITSLALATFAVGFVVPKVNQAITRRMKKKEAENASAVSFNAINNDKSQNINMQNFLSGNKQNDVAFTGAINGAKLMNFVNTFETTPKYQLIAEDGGVLFGRTTNSRNKIEGLEIAFRDGTSTYFYMFNTPIMASMFNKILGGSRIDPVQSEILTRHLIDMMGERTSMSVEEFRMAALGDDALRYRIKPEFERILQKNGGRIILEEPGDLQKFFPDLKLEAIKSMSELQPQVYIKEANAKKSILTKGQIEDLLIGGKINSPEVLHDIYAAQSTPDKLYKIEKAIYNKEHPYGYVQLKELEGTKEHSKTFIDDIINAAKKRGQEITKELIESVNKKQFYKQAFSWGTSFAVSILFLSMLIPKAQYWITRQITGSDEFPGTAEYDKKKA